jgi:hypothetical protein
MRSLRLFLLVLSCSSAFVHAQPVAEEARPGGRNARAHEEPRPQRRELRELIREQQSGERGHGADRPGVAGGRQLSPQERESLRDQLRQQRIDSRRRQP